MTGVQPIEWLAIAPPLILAITAIVVLVVDALGAREQSWLPGGLAVLGVVGAAIAVVPSIDRVRGAFCLPVPEGAPAACSYVVDRLTLGIWVVVLVGTLVTVLLSAVGAIDRRVPTGEHHFLLLASATGALTIAAGRDLITIVVALEVVSLPAFAMVGLRRGDRRSAEGALKFFLVSVVSTAVMLYGISLVYGVTGTMHVTGIGAGLAADGPTHNVLLVGVLLTLVGLLFKVAAVPFHGWVPDTYVGAPVAVAAYLSVVSKTAGFVGLLVIVSQGVGPAGQVWGQVIAVLAALTMTVGNVLAMRQRHAVRLLAWSSVAQSGFVLSALALTVSDRPGVAQDALTAVVAYLIIYAVMNMGAFAVVAMMTRHRPAGRIADYQGLIRREPWAGVGLAFALLCLAGLPPGVVGLFAKVVVFQAVVAGGVGWLAVVMAVNVAIGLAYYLRWMVVVLGPVPDDPVEAASPDVHPVVGGAIGATLVAAAGLSVWPAIVLQVLT